MIMKGMSKFGPGGLHVVFNPRDPDTPCMVYLHKAAHQASATFGCAWDTSEVEGIELTLAQSDFLNDLHAAANDFEDAVKSSLTRKKT